mgnify:FL=1
MNKLEQLAEDLDKIDVVFHEKNIDRTDPLWSKYVNQKDSIVYQMSNYFSNIPDTFPLSNFLLSSSYGRQTVAVVWIRYKKDATYLNIVCYMLLNIPSNFIAYHILGALDDIMSQCDYEQLCQIQKTLNLYSPSEKTSRFQTKVRLLGLIKPKIEFSIDDILKNSYWWKDVESQFFNSLAGVLQYRIVAIQIIRNRKLFEQFHEYRSHLDENNNKTFFVYHGASSETLQSIAKNGFLTPDKLSTVSTKKNAALDPGYFGRGIYHGFAADYAIHYSEVYRQSNEILLSMIAPGRSYVVKKGGEKFGSECQSGYDSHISPERKEIVLFRSEQILPLFIIRFQRIPNAPTQEEKY